MGVQAIEGGFDTTRVSTIDQQRRDKQRANAYGNLSVIACNKFLGSDWHTECGGDPDKWTGDPAQLRAARAWRDETAAVLGLNPGKVTA